MSTQQHEKNAPVIPLDVEDTDETREPTGEDLKFNEEKDSFELEAETEDAEYQHPEPYDTAAPRGEDNNSTYDEENPYTADEYRDKKGQATHELEGLDTVIADEKLAGLDDVDERIADTGKGDAADLDDEGYPLRDDAGGSHNPIMEDPKRPDQRPDVEEGPEEEVGEELPPSEDPRRDDEPIWDDPNRPLEPEDAPPVDERDPLGDKQIQANDPMEEQG